MLQAGDGHSPVKKIFDGAAPVYIKQQPTVISKACGTGAAPANDWCSAQAPRPCT